MCRYEQGRNLAYDGLPVNAALSMGVHESQSLLWERMVALSLPFAKYLRVRGDASLDSPAGAKEDCPVQWPQPDPSLLLIQLFIFALLPYHGVLRSPSSLRHSRRSSAAL